MNQENLYKCLNIVEIYNADTNRSIFTILPTCSKEDDVTFSIDLHQISQGSTDYINFLTGFKYYSINSKFLSPKFIDRNKLEINVIKSFYSNDLLLEDNFRRAHDVFLNFMNHVILNYEKNDLVKVCFYNDDEVCVDSIYGVITDIKMSNTYKIVYYIYCNAKEIKISSSDVDTFFKDILTAKKNEKCRIMPIEHKKYAKRYDLCFSKYQLDQS
jgi:hypothetical protein